MIISVTPEDATRAAALRPIGRSPERARESDCVRHIPMVISDFTKYRVSLASPACRPLSPDARQA